MKPLALGLCTTCLLLSAACGDDDATTASSAREAVDVPAAASADTTAGGTVLKGLVGKEGDPDAFSITLTDADGKAVTTVPAGTYTITVDDRSAIHNFHLTGGAVDAGTSVPEVGEQTFTVDLAAGTYTWKCDPHPKMAGELVVT